MKPTKYVTKTVRTAVIAMHMRELARKRAASLTRKERVSIATKASRAAAKARTLRAKARNAKKS